MSENSTGNDQQAGSLGDGERIAKFLARAGIASRREAEKLIRKALRYDPESPAIIDSLGWVLFKLGHYEDALVELERAYEGMQDHEVAAHIVETLVALGRRDEAMEWLVKAEEEKPDSPLLKDVRDRLFADDP